MRISRASPNCILQLTILFCLVSLSSCSETRTSLSACKKELENAHLTAIQAQQEAEKSKKDLSAAQDKVKQLQANLEEKQKQNSFLYGFMVSAALLALFTGIGLGTKARKDSLVSQKGKVNGAKKE